MMGLGKEFLREVILVLSADRPCIDPVEDLFGHAPFAEHLARSILSTPNPQGMVMALFGKWGSGKTTLLRFIRYFIETNTVAVAEKPIIVEFNPWWFSGREDLAGAFLTQFQAVMPKEDSDLVKVGELLGEYAESIGALIDLSGVTVGFGRQIGKLVSKVFKKKPKDVPIMKAQVSKLLRRAKRPILVLIDDIDRLEDEEVKQLFTVIKALADFPYVTYLLAFDRDMAVRAINNDNDLTGEQYLEKIIQVPFELPQADEASLQKMLFKGLDEVLFDTPEEFFDKWRWSESYTYGIAPLIRVPRDVVRMINTLSVTYPAVKGEVNPVDFISIEAIRVFLPSLYGWVRAHSDIFVGTKRDESLLPISVGSDAMEEEKWFKQLCSKGLRSCVEHLLTNLFPKLSGIDYTPDWLGEWRRDLRICHPDIFPIYFRLSLPAGAISRREIFGLIELANQTELFKQKLLSEKSERQDDGITKLGRLLDRLLDHLEKDISLEKGVLIIESLLDIGDHLDEKARNATSILDYDNDTRVKKLLYHLLKRYPSDEAFNILMQAIREGEAIYAQGDILSTIERVGIKGEEKPPIETEKLQPLKELWMDKLRSLLSINHKKCARMLFLWSNWGNQKEIKEWCSQKIATDDDLIVFVAGFLQTSSSTSRDGVIIKPRLNPQWMEKYVDINDVASRLRVILETREVSSEKGEAIKEYLAEYELLKEGKDPDKIDFFE